MAWYSTSLNSVDTRDPMGSTVAYTARNVGAAALPTSSTVTCTAGGIGVGVITITIPAGANRCSAQVVVRPLAMPDVARYGGEVTNIDANLCDTEATYEPLARWLW